MRQHTIALDKNIKFNKIDTLVRLEYHMTHTVKLGHKNSSCYEFYLIFITNFCI